MIKRLVSLAWPLFLAQLAVTGMAVTDTIVAGWAGTHELAVVAVGANLLLLGIMFVYGVLLILSPQVAEMRITQPDFLPVLLQQGMIVGVGAGVLACLIIIVMLKIVPFFVNEVLLVGITQYLLFGLPALILAGVYFALRLFWEGLHFTHWTAFVSILLFLVNIPLDWFFVIEMNLGGAGCALATLVSFIIAIVISFILFKQKAELRPMLDRLYPLKLHQSVLTRMVRLGLPASLALLSEVSLFMLLALLIAPFGVVALAGHQIAINITSVLYILPFSLSLALAIEVGRLQGQGNRQALVRLMKRGMVLSLVVGMGLSILTYLLHERLPMAFTHDDAVRQMASTLLLFAAAYQVADALQMGSAGILRGLGDTRWIMGVTLISYWVVGIPLGAWLAWSMAWQAAGYWVGVVVALTLAGVLLAMRVRTQAHRLI